MRHTLRGQTESRGSCAATRVVRRRCYCSKAVAVVAVEYTHKDRNTSVSPYGNGAHMDPWERGAVGCVAFICSHLVGRRLRVLCPMDTPERAIEIRTACLVESLPAVDPLCGCRTLVPHGLTSRWAACVWCLQNGLRWTICGCDGRRHAAREWSRDGIFAVSLSRSVAHIPGPNGR